MKMNKSLHNRLLVFIVTIIIIFSADKDLRYYLAWLPAALVLSYFLIIDIKSRRLSKGFMKVIGLSLIWSMYSSLNILEIKKPDLHFQAILEMMLWLSFFYLLYNYLDRKRDILIPFLLLLTKLFAIFSMFQWFFFLISHSFNTAFSGFFDNRNDFAVLTAFFLSLQVFLPDKKNRLDFLLEACLCLLIFVTFSTKGIFSIAIIYFLYLKNRFGSVAKLFLVPIFVITFFFAINSSSYMSERINDKIESISHSDKVSIDTVGNDSGKIRLLLYFKTMEFIKNNPWFGVGINNAQFYMPVPKSWKGIKTLNTQNNYSEMLMNAGIPGFILYYFPYIIMIFYFFKTRGNINNLCSCLLMMKFFNDTGMKSYNEVSQLISISFVFYIYFNRKKVL